MVRQVIDSVLEGVDENLYILVPISLVFPHVAMEHLQDLPIVAFTLAIGMRLIVSRDVFRETHHLEDPAEELRLQLATIVCDHSFEGPYLKIHSYANARATVYA